MRYFRGRYTAKCAVSVFIFMLFLIGTASKCVAGEARVTAEKLVSIMYPEFKDACVAIHEESRLKDVPGSHFIVKLRTAARPCTSDLPSDADLLDVDFQFVVYQDLPDFVYVFKPPAWDRAVAFQKKSSAHQEWTTEHLAREMRASGAKYPPDRETELLNSLPIRELERVFGKIQITDATFQRTESTDVPDGWILSIRTHRDGRRDINFIVGVEPFDGKIDGIHLDAD